MRSPLITSVQPLSVQASPGIVWTFVEIVDAEGFCGLGETSSADHEALEQRIRSVGLAMLGKRVPVCDRACSGDTSAIHRRARSAIDQALWDLRAQHAGKALAASLGEPKRTLVRTYANLNRGLVDRSAAAAGHRAAKARASGFDVFKIAPFDGVTPFNCNTADGQVWIGLGMQRVASVRDEIGDASALLIDCHWRFDERTAFTVIEQLAQFNVSWIECPMPETRDTLETLTRLRRHANAFGARLAGADEVDDIDFFGDVIAAQAYDVVMPDVKYLGGLLPALHLAELAERHDVICSFHNPSGPVAHLHSVHLSALLKNELHLEFAFGEMALYAEIMHGDPAIPRSGRAALPVEVGLGAILNPVLMASRMARDSKPRPPSLPSAMALPRSST